MISITPIIKIETISSVQVTSFVNDIEQNNIRIEYIRLLDNGEVKDRDCVFIDNYDDVKKLYKDLDDIIATGKTFEEASAKLLYFKVIEKLNSATD